MRLLFLLHAHPSLQAGGTEIFARDLFRSLRQMGLQGSFVAATGAHQRPPSPGTALQTVGDEPDELLLWSGGFDPFHLSQVDSYGVSAALRELLSHQQPDLIHFHHFLGLGVEVIDMVRRHAPHAPIVMTLHDYYPICANDGQMVTSDGTLCSAASLDRCHRCFPQRSLSEWRLRDLHIRGSLAAVDKFIAPSHFLRDRYIAWGLPADRIEVVCNGIPISTPAAHRPPRRRDRFGFFGHINRFKGATVALEASTILSRRGVDHSLSLHGGTSHQTEDTIARFRAACEKAPSARFGGPYERSDLPRLLAPMDWVVFPSVWWENAPLVIQEAFQHRRPVICSDIGGAAESVRNEINGLHFPVGDAHALADAMERAIVEQDLWQRLVDGIERPVGIGSSAEEHLRIYQALIDRVDRAKLAA